MTSGPGTTVGWEGHLLIPFDNLKVLSFTFYDYNVKGRAGNTGGSHNSRVLEPLICMCVFKNTTFKITV